MREKINRLAKGILDTEVLELFIVPEMIQRTVKSGERTKDELLITDTQGRFIKGLVYSSNTRVRVLSDAFGGVRNRVAYEIDSQYLTKGDSIKGEFCLVTNGGEKKISYEFTVELGSSGKTMEELKTPSDFANLAKENYELALRLFEYQDFTQAPFMQNLHIRALYDGLSGRLNRQNRMEEFLVALKTKKSVRLFVNPEKISHEHFTESEQGMLQVQAEGWGYVRFEASVDGDFIQLEKNVYQMTDFIDGACNVKYRIQSESLHSGKNLGAIHIQGVRKSLIVPVEIQTEEDFQQGITAKKQMALGTYLKLRLEYEIGIQEDRILIQKMQTQLDDIRKLCGESLDNILRQAELYILQGDKKRAAEHLENCKQEIQKIKSDKVYFCYYQYLVYLLQKKDGQRESLLNTVEKYLEEAPDRYELFLLRLKVEPSLKEVPVEMLKHMQALYELGCHSPYLYIQAFKMYEHHPDLIISMGDFQCQVMTFAVKHDLIEESMALRIAGFATGKKHYRAIYYRLLTVLYEKYPRKELLNAVCCMLIKGDCRDKKFFKWYEKALEEQISLTRLYEYFLYSLPRDYSRLLPKEVLMYFLYERNIDEYSCSVLYVNIIRYMKPEAALYKQYERYIEQFAMQHLLQSRINRRLVVLYQHILYKEMIDEGVARVLPAILKSYRVEVKNPNIRYVVVCYEELEGEDAFPVKDGVAYVPLFGGHPVILFQDEYGNRYYNISHRKLPAMEGKNLEELEERCYDIYPNHPMLRIQECSEIVDKGISSDAEVSALRRAILDLHLHPLFERRILSRMISFYRQRMELEGADSSQDVNYLMDMNLEELNQEERAGVCETLILQDYIREAFELIKTYGTTHIRSARLLKLCTRMILQQLFDEDEILLKIAVDLFKQNRYDGVVLDYLCEHYNGSTEQMYQILCKAQEERVEVYDMPERLLAQMLFANEIEYVDCVFEWYVAGKRTSEQVIKAYFTMKSEEYFLQEKETGEKVFAYLEGTVHGIFDKNKVPTIYLLALTKYYSTLEVLDEERKVLCKSMVEQLLEEGRIFSYFHQLGRHIPMPLSVMNKVILEYHSSAEAKPELQIRITPEDEDYSLEEFTRVFQRIYVCQKVLFYGEAMEYRVYETKDDARILTKEGTLTAEMQQQSEDENQLAVLNHMQHCILEKNEIELKEKMRSYITKYAITEELFHLM